MSDPNAAKLSPRKPRAGTGRPSSSPCLEELPAVELLKACRTLGGLWALPPEACATLLGTSRTTWFRWQEAAETGGAPPWTPDQRARALAWLRIFEAVGDLHQADLDAYAWPHEPLGAPGFAGRTPLEVMLSGFEGLLLVRDYLNFLLGAWS